MSAVLGPPEGCGYRRLVSCSTACRTSGKGRTVLSQIGAYRHQYTLFPATEKPKRGAWAVSFLDLWADTLSVSRKLSPCTKAHGTSVHSYEGHPTLVIEFLAQMLDNTMPANMRVRVFSGGRHVPHLLGLTETHLQPCAESRLFKL